MTNARPQSELYREAAMHHADADAAARMLEETKSIVFAELVQQALKAGCPSVARAELEVRAGQQYRDFVDRMVRSRTNANRARYQLEFIRMQHWEKTQDRADQRFEARIAP